MADKKLKISPNPVKAYYQGKAEGERYAKAADIDRGVRLAYCFLLLAMAYTNEKDDGTTYLSKPKFREFYQTFAKTLKKFVDDSIEGEDGITIDDIADMYFVRDEFIRDRYGLPHRNYDGKDDIV